MEKQNLVEMSHAGACAATSRLRASRRWVAEALLYHRECCEGRYFGRHGRRPCCWPDRTEIGTANRVRNRAA